MTVLAVADLFSAINVNRYPEPLASRGAALGGGLGQIAMGSIRRGRKT